MSNNGGWKPRKLETLTCPFSGQKVQVRRPGPELALRAGRVAKTFTASKDENDGKMKGIDQMSDEELAAVTIFARELVCAMLVSPKLVLNPDPDKDEVGPDDIGNDFWFLFNYAMSNFYNLEVPVGDGEVKVSDLESFREDSGVSGDSVDSAHVPPDAEQPDGDRRLVSGAGA